MPTAALAALGPVRRPGRCGNSARGAYRAWARKKAGLRGGILTALGPVRRPGGGGNADRGADRAWAREKVKLLWEIQAAPRPMRATGRGKKLFTAEKSPLLRDDLEPVVVGQQGHKQLLP